MAVCSAGFLRGKGRFAGKLALLLVVVCALTVLSACGHDEEDYIFRYDIAEPVDSLDPQFATDPNAVLILGNLYEGLVVLGEDGEILPGVAQSYTVSDDGLTYTFKLRSDAVWHTGEPIVAEDFIYAFTRLFKDQSPYAQNYFSILGAQEMYGGTSDTLPGVSADGPHTLTLTLARTDSQLLAQLCEPAAAPCNETFFTSARGRYGLEMDLVCSNGPFELGRWDDVRVSLLKSEHYVSEQPTVAEAVHFYIARDAEEKYLDDNTDLAILDADIVAKREDDIKLPIAKTVWGIVFDQDHAIWKNAMIRQAMALCVDPEMLEKQMPDGFAATSLFLPDSLQVMGESYRPLAFAESPLGFRTGEALRLYELGLEQLDVEQLPMGLKLTVAETSKTTLNLIGLQQAWQSHLSVYIGMETVADDELESRLYSGDYGMILVPFTAETADAADMLDVFAADSDRNVFGYDDAVYDGLLETAAAQTTAKLAAGTYAQAEKKLLSDAVVIPLYAEATTMLIDDDVQDLWISAFGDRMYFKYAHKD